MTASTSVVAEQGTVAGMRKLALVILVMGLVGTAAELLLLGHYENGWQLVPLVLIVVALVELAWYGAARTAGPLRALRLTMWLFLVAGAIGIVQHFRTNVTDARESNPGLSRRDAWREAVSGSIPALAPGTMFQLGLVGLAFLFRHPRYRNDAGAGQIHSQTE